MPYSITRPFGAIIISPCVKEKDLQKNRFVCGGKPDLKWPTHSPHLVGVISVFGDVLEHVEVGVANVAQFPVSQSRLDDGSCNPGVAKYGQKCVSVRDLVLVIGLTIVHVLVHHLKK